MMFDAKKGDWVQIYRVVLQPDQRAPQVPDDTKKLPVTVQVNGFLTQDANLRDTVIINTVIGRTIRGELIAINPSYDHSFGPPPDRIMNIGGKLRRMLIDES